MSWPRSRRRQSGTATTLSVLIIGRERHSNGQDDEQREPAKKLTGVDCRVLSVRTSLVGEEQCPAADARGSGIRERERARAQEDEEPPLMEESVLKTIFRNNLERWTSTEFAVSDSICQERR